MEWRSRYPSRFLPPSTVHLERVLQPNGDLPWQNRPQAGLAQRPVIHANAMVEVLMQFSLDASHGVRVVQRQSLLFRSVVAVQAMNDESVSDTDTCRTVVNGLSCGILKTTLAWYTGSIRRLVSYRRCKKLQTVATYKGLRCRQASRDRSGSGSHALAVSMLVRPQHRTGENRRTYRRLESPGSALL